jgi:hypothetical protein
MAGSSPVFLTIKSFQIGIYGSPLRFIKGVDSSFGHSFWWYSEVNYCWLLWAILPVKPCGETDPFSSPSKNFQYNSTYSEGVISFPTDDARKPLRASETLVFMVAAVF